MTDTMKKNFILFSAGVLLIFPLLAQQRNLSEKEAFGAELPQFYQFRGEMKRSSHADYTTWCSSVSASSGIIKKYMCEELKINPAVCEWANRFSQTHPQKLHLLHLNGEGRQVNDYPEVCNKYFPGHWVYEAGSTLTEDCDEKQTRIKVAATSCFLQKAYIYRNLSPVVWKPHYVLLVELDEQGNRRWYNSEVAHITAINADTRTLTVERGKTNTRSRSFKAGKTYLAPIAGGVWGNDVMFYYNLSACCPKDKNGQTAADVFTDEIAGWFASKGILENLDGIAFDVNYFDVSKHKEWDTDNDGKADGGWIGNRNIWREGDWRFLQNLRQRMGNDFIITCDGQHSVNQQAVGILNGIESEGLVQHNDGWRGFSRTLNTHLYWRVFNPLPLQFYYVVLKLMDVHDSRQTDRLKRFGVATASCLGAYTTAPDSYSFLPAWVQSRSFGRVQGELIRCAKSTPEVLKKTPDSLAKEGKLRGEDCRITIEGNFVKVTSDHPDKNRTMTLSINDLELPAGDLTFFIEAKTMDNASMDAIPRFMHVHLSNLPSYKEDKKASEFYENLYGLIGNQKHENAYYFRRQGVAAGRQTLKLTIEGTEKVCIYSIKVYNKPDILIRCFEQAIVCVNPSLEIQEVDLSAFVPGYPSQQTTVGAVDAVFIQQENK